MWFTHIMGTNSFGLMRFTNTADIDLKKAGKMFGQKFACGSSASGDEITVQGDISDELMDYILECFPVCPCNTCWGHGDFSRRQ